MSASGRFTVLHYLAYDGDQGGIVSVVRGLAAADRFDCLLGVNRGFQARRLPVLPVLEFPPLTGEKLDARTFWRARKVATQVRAWLTEDPLRCFHGHSRAGLAVALWLHRWGERRMVASVHCYGRSRWFYRWAERALKSRLFWLSPAMKRYYGIADDRSWTQCIPGCVRPGTSPVFVGPLDGQVRLGGIGALVRWKNWGLVIEALAALPPEARRRFRFRHIGGTDGTAESASYAGELRETARRRGVADLVEWRGEQPSSEALLRETDCLIVASVNEPFSVAMLEALQAGVPVVAADSGGASDVVVAGRNGEPFRTGDAGALARVLAALPADPRRAFPMPPSDLRRFEAAAVAAEWEQVYAGLASAR